MCFMALTAILHVTVGLPLIHPTFHANGFSSPGHNHILVGGADRETVRASELPAHVGACPICKFMSSYHAPALPALAYSPVFLLLLAVIGLAPVVHETARVPSPHPRAPPLN